MLHGMEEAVSTGREEAELRMLRFVLRVERLDRCENEYIRRYYRRVGLSGTGSHWRELCMGD